MKLARTKIVAAAMAALTTVCATQSLTASAYTFGSAHVYTTGSAYQARAEGAEGSWMTTNVNYWKQQNQFKPNKTWSSSDNVVCGYVVKQGFQNGTYSGKAYGSTLTGSQALVRRLANDYYNNCHGHNSNGANDNPGCPAYLELTPNQRYFQAQLGDQLHVVSGGRSKWVFVMALPTAATNYKMQTIELDDKSRICYNVSYDYQTAFLTNSSGTQWTIDYYARPIKQGDANGDGAVCPEQYDPCHSGSDLNALKPYSKIRNQNNSFPSNITGTARELWKAAVDLDRDGFVDLDDYEILEQNIYSQRDPSKYNNGRMEYSHGRNWYYVQRF